MSEPKVFISYSRDDADWASEFAEALRDQRVDVWLDKWQLHAGDSLSDALEEGLRGSDAIVAILSETNAKRPNTFFEFGVALGMGKRLIPIVPEDMDRSFIPFELRSRVSVTKSAPAETARQVAEALRGRAA
jgi:hypothetical protein